MTKAEAVLEAIERRVVDGNLPYGTVAEIGREVGCTRSYVSVIARRHGYARATPRPILEHGTLSMYAHGHCRCDPCKEVWREYYRAYHAKKKAQSA